MKNTIIFTLAVIVAATLFVIGIFVATGDIRIVESWRVPIVVVDAIISGTIIGTVLYQIINPNNRHEF